MKSFLPIFATLVFGLSPSLASAQTRGGKPRPPKIVSIARTELTPAVDKVIAAIDGEPVTASEYARFASTQGGGPTPKLRDYIMQLLLEKEAKASGIVVTDAEVKAYVDEVKRQNNLDDEGLETLLASQRFSREDYETQVRGDIARNRFISSRFRAKVAVSDEEIENYVSENPRQQLDGASAHVQQILVPSDGTVSDAEGVAEGILSKLKGGEPWAEAGGEYFTDLGYMKEADLLPALQDALKDTEIGKPSNVIRLPGGFAIVAVLDRTEGEKISSAQKEALRAQLSQEKMKRMVEEYFATELPDKYLVEIKN